MDMDHDQVRELGGLYVLDALEADERVQFEAHLTTCRACAEEVRALSVAAGALPFAVPLVEPSSALRDRVRAVARGPVGDVSARVAAFERPGPRPRSSWSWMRIAALVIGGVGMALYALALRQQVGALELSLQDAVVRL